MSYFDYVASAGGVKKVKQAGKEDNSQVLEEAGIGAGQGALTGMGLGASAGAAFGPGAPIAVPLGMLIGALAGGGIGGGIGANTGKEKRRAAKQSALINSTKALTQQFTGNKPAADAGMSAPTSYAGLAKGLEVAGAAPASVQAINKAEADKKLQQLKIQQQEDKNAIVKAKLTKAIGDISPVAAGGGVVPYFNHDATMPMDSLNRFQPQSTFGGLAGR